LDPGGVPPRIRANKKGAFLGNFIYVFRRWLKPHGEGFRGDFQLGRSLIWKFSFGKVEEGFGPQKNSLWENLLPHISFKGWGRTTGYSSGMGVVKPPRLTQMGWGINQPLRGYKKVPW